MLDFAAIFDNGARVAKKKSPKQPKPVKKRLTWWHPLFGGALEYSSKDSFEVLAEEEVGQLPMLIDIIILLLAENRPLPEWTLNAAPSLFTRLNECTIIEFKGPTDSLEDGDFALSLSRALAWTSRHERKLTNREITMIFIAPRLTSSFKAEIERLGGKVREEAKGIFEVSSSTFETWVIESIEGEKRGEPLLSLVSPRILNDPHDVFDKLDGGPYTEFLGFCFRQIQKFQKNRKEFRLRYEQTEEMSNLLEEVREEILESVTDEEKKKLIQTIPVKDRLDGIAVEDRLDGIAVEDRLDGLSDGQKRQLFEQWLKDSESTDQN